VQLVEVESVEQAMQMQTSWANVDQALDRKTHKTVLASVPTVVILQQQWDQAMQAAVSKFSQNSR